MPQIFFYGLFMDEVLLSGKGLHPVIIGPARLDGYRIRIMDRATLVGEPGAAAFGIVMQLTGKESEVLYAAPDLSDYRPEEVDVVMLKDELVRQVSCYNLPTAALRATNNVDYTEALAKLVKRLEFPADYLREIFTQSGVASKHKDGSK